MQIYWSLKVAVNIVATGLKLENCRLNVTHNHCNLKRQGLMNPKCGWMNSYGNNLISSHHFPVAVFKKSFACWICLWGLKVKKTGYELCEVITERLSDNKRANPVCHNYRKIYWDLIRNYLKLMPSLSPFKHVNRKERGTLNRWRHYLSY
jgi:hypothetical protein